MKKVRSILLTLLIVSTSLFTVGCWNYREVDKLAIVAGVAIDKGKNGQYKLTAEIANISGAKDTKTSSEIVTIEGKTIFDAARNAISLNGKRLYWSHAKVIILSKEVASEGVTKIIDWYNRDSETRPDVYLLITERNSAKDLFSGQGLTEEIKSFELEEMTKNQRSLSKAPVIEILRFDNDLQGEGVSPIAPAINLKQINGKVVPQIEGTAIFKKDKLVGFLNGDETKALTFIKNEVKGGVLVEGTQGNTVTTPVSLEIFKNKTKVTPVVDSKGIKINVSVETTVAIDEIEGTENLLDEEGRKKLEQSAEKELKERITALIKKMQSIYDVDIFGFGAKLREDKYEVWKQVSSNWDEVYKNIEVNVVTKVHIRNSAVLSKTLEERD